MKRTRFLPTRRDGRLTLLGRLRALRVILGSRDVLIREVAPTGEPTLRRESR